MWLSTEFTLASLEQCAIVQLADALDPCQAPAMVAVALHCSGGLVPSAVPRPACQGHALEQSCAAQAELPPVASCLQSDRRGMKRAMMEVVVGGAVSTPADVQRYAKATLLAATQDFQVLQCAGHSNRLLG